jgi:hypothetical protein
MRITRDTSYSLVNENLHVKALWGKSNLTKLHIAVLVKKGKIIETATNFLGSRSSGCGYDNRSIHAERALLKKLGNNNRMNGATMIVIRLTQGTNQLSNSKPCEGCEPHLKKCIKLYKLKAVYYSI